MLGGPLLGSTIVGSTALGRPAQLNRAHLVKAKDGKLVVVKGTMKLRVNQVAPARLGKAIPKQALLKIEAQFAKSLPARMSKAQRAAAIKAFDQNLRQHLLGRHVIAQIGKNGSGFVKAGTGPLAIAGAHANAPHVIGTGWLSVAATPPSPAVAAAVQQALHGGLGTGQARTTVTYGSSAASGSPTTSGWVAYSPSTATAYSSTLAVSPPVGPDLAVLQALLKATVRVHGSWGSGRLLKTTLLTVLVTSKGQILAGAVTPSVLYADVAADAG